MFALNLLRSQIKRQIKRPNCMQMYTKAKFKDGGEYPTFNDVPIPKGSWKEDYARKQSRYNMILFSGIASFICSVLFVANSSNMVFNMTVPDYPYDEE